MTEKSKKVLMWFLETALNFGIIIILVIVIQTWIIAPFDVSGRSMCNTLNYIDGECQGEGVGEKIIINEAIYLFGEPQRGEIVVFRAPNQEEETYFIKRIIGVPGDLIEIKDGYVYRKTAEEQEFQKLEENYLNEKNRGNTQLIPKYQGPDYFTVPEGKYFLLGDNRAESTDSRSCFHSTSATDCKQNPEESFITQENIRGKAWLVWWPLSNIRVLSGEVELQ